MLDLITDPMLLPTDQDVAYLKQQRSEGEELAILGCSANLKPEVEEICISNWRIFDLPASITNFPGKRKKYFDKLNDVKNSVILIDPMTMHKKAKQARSGANVTRRYRSLPLLGVQGYLDEILVNWPVDRPKLLVITRCEELVTSIDFNSASLLELYYPEYYGPKDEASVLTFLRAKMEQHGWSSDLAHLKIHFMWRYDDAAVRDLQDFIYYHIF